MTIKRRHSLTLSLLSATMLTMVAAPVWAACPGAVSGTVTVSGDITDCHLDNNANNLVVTSTGIISTDNDINYAVAILSSDNASAGNITNNGTIAGGTYMAGIEINGSTVTGSIENNNSLTGVYGVLVNNNGSLTNGIVNNDNINGSNTGILLDSGNLINGVVNSGNITGGEGILLNNGAILSGGITNNANASINDDNFNFGFGISVIDSTLNGDISNAGTIDGGEGAIGFNGGTLTGNIINNNLLNGGYGILLDNVSTITGNITNNASIEASSQGIFLYNSTVDGDIVNTGFGTILSGGDGIFITHGSTVTGAITNSNTITTNDTGIYIANSTIMGGISNTRIINAGGSGILITGSTITGDITNYGTISGANGLIVSGTVNGTILNTGTLIGTSGDALAVNTTGPVSVNNSGILNGNVSLTNAELNLNGTATRVIGNITGGLGSAVNINGDFTTEGNMTADDIVIGNDVRLDAGDFLYQTTNGFINNGTLAVSNNEMAAITGDYTQDVGDTFELALSTATDRGNLTISGIGDFAAGTGLFINVLDGGSLSVNEPIADIISAGTLNASSFTVTDNSFLFNFNPIIDGNTVDLGLVQNVTVAESVDNENNNAGRGAARALDDAIQNDTNGNFADVTGAFAALGSQQEVSDAVTQTLPLASGGTTQAILNMLDTTGRIVQAREEGEKGLSSGDGFITHGDAWFKPFGSWAEQDSDANASGFESDSYGIMIGADKLTTEALRLGAAFTYANSDVKGTGTAAQKVDIDTYQATLYGSYGLEAQTDLNFQIGAGFNTNDGSRRIAFGGLNSTASSDYNGYNFDAGIGLGHSYDIANATSFTPSVRADYMLVTNESYAESGAGALNLNVAHQTADQLIPAIEGKLHHSFDQGFSVAANLGLGYDILADDNQVTSSFAGGGGAFVTNGVDQSPWVERAGVGVALDDYHGVEVSVRYDTELRGSDYDNNSVSLKLRTSF